MNKKMCALVMGMSIALVSVAPVYAAERTNGCLHNWGITGVESVFEWNNTQHRVGKVVTYHCTRCSAVLTEDPGWEDHNMVTDGNSMVDHGYGVISYDRECSVCGHGDTIYIQIP